MFIFRNQDFISSTREYSICQLSYAALRALDIMYLYVMCYTRNGIVQSNVRGI